MGEAVNIIFSGLIDILKDFTDYIVVQLREGLRWLYNTLASGIEALLNGLRTYLKYIILVLVTWYGIYSTMTKAELGIKGRILGMLGSFIGGVLASEIFDAIVPIKITIPRWYNIIPEQVSEQYYQLQYAYETIEMIEAIMCSGILMHTQFSIESIEIT